jgi:hypothetical protein
VMSPVFCGCQVASAGPMPEPAMELSGHHLVTLCETVLVKFGKRNSGHFDFVLFCSKLRFLPTRPFVEKYGVGS